MLHKKRKPVNLFILSVLLCFIPMVSVHAEGNINGNEAAVLAALDGEFTYEGNVYVVASSYKASLRAYFARDGVDLTESQKSACLSKITSNIGTAVREGYLVKVGSAGQEETPKTDSESTKKSTTKPKEEKKKTEKETTKKESAKKESTKKEKNKKEETRKEGGKETQTNAPSATPDTERIGEQAVAGEQSSGTSKPDGQTKESKEEQNVSGTDKKTAETTDNGSQEQKDSGEKACNYHVLFLVLGGAGVIILLAILFLWKKRRNKPLLCEETYTDMHCHILPGVDDGAKNMEESVAMLRKAYKQGIRTIIATPHYVAGKKKTSPEKLEEIRSQLQAEAKKEGFDMEILLGNELYYSQDICERLDEKKALTMAGSRYVLVEFSPEETYKEIYRGIHKLVQGGYIPILAHMERYRCLHGDTKKIRDLIELGTYMQMNVQSLQNRYCKKLAKDGYIHFFGSDAHNTGNRQPRMQDGIKWLGGAVDKELLEKIFIENPKMLRENKYIRKGRKGL